MKKISGKFRIAALVTVLVAAAISWPSAPTVACPGICEDVSYCTSEWVIRRVGFNYIQFCTITTCYGELAGIVTRRYALSVAPSTYYLMVGDSKV